jgi:hypothetical protein
LSAPWLKLADVDEGVRLGIAGSESAGYESWRNGTKTLEEGE